MATRANPGRTSHVIAHMITQPTQLDRILPIADRPQTVRIVPATVELLDSFRECIDSVARERKWLGAVQAHSREETREYWGKHIAEDSPAFFALDGQRVVGFIDIVPQEREGIRHRGQLGMGVHVDYRGRGIGTRLMEAAIGKARARGLIRVDLGVYVSNPKAIALYKKFGFVEEGRIVKGRYLDGRFDDIIQMGLIFEENLPKQK